MTTELIFRFAMIFTCAFTFSFTSLHAQESKTDTEAPATKSEHLDPFNHSLAGYKDILRKIETLRAEFQTAKEPRQLEINKQLVDLLASAKKTLDQMITAGIEAYREAPGSNSQVEELLLNIVKHKVVGYEIKNNGGNHLGGDDYEAALPIVKLLMEGKSKNELLPLWGGVAAFNADDFEFAKTCFQAAKENGWVGGAPPIKDEKDSRIFDFTVGNKFFAQMAMHDYPAMWKKEQAIRKKEAEADDLPQVKITTNKGEITVELYENEAPNTVANFISLVKSGYYSGLAFHRVLPHFMIQGGDNKKGGPGYTIRCECFKPDNRKHFRGTLSMAHTSQRDTGGAQFFITFGPTSHLDGVHTAFGRVIDGFDVLGQIQKIDPVKSGRAPKPDLIIKAEVLRDRGHGYKVKKM